MKNTTTQYRFVMALSIVSVVALASLPKLSWGSTTPELACARDCNRDGAFTIDELVGLVNIAAGNSDVLTCQPGDLNGDGVVVVNELVAAVHTALTGEQPRTLSLTQVGHLPLATINADVWAHGDFAYVGTPGLTPVSPIGPSRCSGTGVKVVDVSEPSDPRDAGTLADHVNTTAEDVMVISVDTPQFQGDLLAVGLQNCRFPGMENGLAGVELWDVSDPRHPQFLAFHDVTMDPAADDHTASTPGERTVRHELASDVLGVHELYLFQREARAFVLLAVPNSDVFDVTHRGDLRIVEVTDPRHPLELADWSVGRDAGLPFGSPLGQVLGPPYDAPPFDCTPPDGVAPACRGDDLALVMTHSVSANQSGTRAYLSQWDGGMIILDIADPAHPVMLGHGVEPLTDEGNMHSAIAIPGDQFAVTTDEDFTGIGPDNPWGAVRVWDITDPHDPIQVASYATPNSLHAVGHGLGGGAYYTVHNPEVHGDLLYLSWYADGVRVLDIADPSAPKPVAAYVPANANIWGVHVQDNLIFLSDITQGLYILEQTDCR